MNNFPGVESRENSIRLSFTYQTIRHKKSYRVDGMLMPPTGPNLRAASRFVKDIKDAIRLGSFEMAEWFPEDELVQAARAAAKAQQRTVAQQLDHYLSIANIEASTRKGYLSAAKFWKKAAREVGDMPITVGETALDDLVYSHLQYAITRFEGSGKTANNYLSVLCKALHIAVRDRLMVDNPAANEELRSEHQRPEPDPFTVAEVDAILGYMNEHYPKPVYNLCDFWAHTGMRTSEVYGALWSAVDLDKKKVLVHRANVRGEEKETTKTNQARALPLNSRAMAALKRQKGHTFWRGRHIFLDPRYDTPWDDERAFRRSYWTPALEALGIRYRSPYQLRHTFATMMLMAGLTPAAAAKRMGHSVQIFLTSYTKWLDGDLDELQNDRLEGFFNRTAPA